jgi:hypothetical protein
MKSEKRKMKHKKQAEQYEKSVEKDMQINSSLFTLHSSLTNGVRYGV